MKNSEDSNEITQEIFINIYNLDSLKIPRVNEISTDVDDDERACYFKQVEYGKFVRMALILKLLEVD